MDNWMSRRPDRLTLSQLTIPGSHDAGMYKSSGHDGRQLATPVSVPSSSFVLTHSQSIFEQLRMGIRMFDVRIKRTRANRLHTFHFTDRFGGYGAGLQEILEQVDLFLSEGQGQRETVILKFSHTEPDSIRNRIMTNVYRVLGNTLYSVRDNRTIGLIPLHELRGKVIAVYEPGFVGDGPFRNLVIPYLNPKGRNAWDALPENAKAGKLVYRGFFSNRRTFRSMVRLQEANLQAWAGVRGGARFRGELMQFYWTSTVNPRFWKGGSLGDLFYMDIEKNTDAIWQDERRNRLQELIVRYSPNIVIIDFVDMDKVRLILEPPGGRRRPPARPSRSGRRRIHRIGPINAEETYRKIMMNKTRGDWNTAGGHPRAQVERDVALWYGAIVRPSSSGYAWKGEMLQRLFLILHDGGLMVNRGAPGQDNWVPWCETDDPIPICSALSHTARILISLPETNNAARQFWRWLWNGHTPQSRFMATHGISGAPRQTIYPHVMKDVRETKGGKAGADIMFDHYGVNIGLGGCGNANPVSGKRVRDNGYHGHLYIAYGKNLRGTHSRQAILVGTEQSAPYDRATVNIAHIKGIPDQYGGRHSLGGHNRYSATGGDDFSYASLDRESGQYRLNYPTELGDYGPSLGHYIDGMFIDLTQERFLRIVGSLFDVSMVGDCGRPPLPPRRRR